MKTAIANGSVKADAKQAARIEDAVREFQTILNELRSIRAKTERLRATSRRLMNDTWETLRRVETTL